MEPAASNYVYNPARFQDYSSWWAFREIVVRCKQLKLWMIWWTLFFDVVFTHRQMNLSLFSFLLFWARSKILESHREEFLHAVKDCLWHLKQPNISWKIGARFLAVKRETSWVHLTRKYLSQLTDNKQESTHDHNIHTFLLEYTQDNDHFRQKTDALAV